MTNSALNKIKTKLRVVPISSLSAKELKVYFLYRLKNLLLKNKVLVKRELVYLMGETGIGSLRLDPEIVTKLNPKETVTINDFMDSRLINENISIIVEEKTRLANDVEKYLDAKLTNRKLISFYQEYIKRIKVLLEKPLVFEGVFQDTPILLISKNGEWVMPNSDLISIIKNSYLSNRVPIFIAKKIHGILFPLFKDISTIGANTYTTFLPQKIVKKIGNFNMKYPEMGLNKIKYNENVSSITTLLGYNSEDITSPIISFFKLHLPKIVKLYHHNFISQNHNFSNINEAVSKMKNRKAKKGLWLWLNNRIEFLRTV
ncbi:hypothetical protein A2160_00545 [Candidatus Beckwithbacteria bacterium RBG_13_42_9]|uniref:Uncharacterized protein n=1 Tax=Candidatus Beckwithbacteria bacterium RBG_13_42_9 TaxID=1797457 RepID=A0A1F5E3P8_9BACT|nr:MAG: hypothetical protein A2160_00545 [Candidatus Beckwithbacteria bacterium RBG_13_42_9]